MSRYKITGNLLKFSLLVFIAAALGGCLKSGSSSSSNANDLSFVTLMNMAPYSSSTSVYFNNVIQTGTVGAGSYSTSYGQIPPGTYDVQFRVAGSDSVLSDLGTSVYDSLGFYTVVLYNPTASSAVSSMKITDDFSTLSLSSANYRFFNFCPDAPSVDLVFNTSVMQNGRTVGDNANSYYLNVFQNLTPGIYSITARKAGTDSVIATLNSVNLTAANAYTIFLMGSTKNTSNPVSLNVLTASY